jgi:hypothetical protein
MCLIIGLNQNQVKRCARQGARLGASCAGGESFLAAETPVSPLPRQARRTNAPARRPRDASALSDFKAPRSPVLNYHGLMDYHCPSLDELAALDHDDPDALWLAWGGRAEKALDVFHGESTLAMDAVQRGAPRCLEFLLRHGADMDAIGQDGWGLTFMAVNYRQNACLRVLLSRGASPQSRLIEAAVRGFADIAETLVDFGASLSATNVLGLGLLEVAAAQGRLAFVEFLARRDPDWLLRADQAIEQARMRGHADCAAFILARQELAALEGSTRAAKASGGLRRI